MALKAHSCATLSLFLAVLILSADTILLKKHRKLSTSASLSVFWKFIFTGAFELMFALYMLDGPYEVWKNLRDDASRYTWLAVFCTAVFSGCCSFALVYGLDVSLVLLLFAMSPLWAAIMDMLFFSKSIGIHTMVAIVISISALAFATIPAIFKLNLSNKSNIYSDSDSSDLKQLITIGLGLLGGITGAGFAVLYRRAFEKGEQEARAMKNVPWLSSLVCIIVTGSIIVVNRLPIAEPSFVATLWSLFNGLVLSIFNVTCVMVAQHLSSVEISLMGQLEGVVVPIWMWLELQVQPNMESVVALGVILIVVASHSIYQSKIVDEKCEASSDKDEEQHLI